jgi:stearoyl-CoA desaturase (delta-9 desaturase)
MTATFSPRPPLASPAQTLTRSSATVNALDVHRRARALHQPRDGGEALQIPHGRNWPVIGFMVAVHALALVALLPAFWSVQAVATLLILYWVTACLGVTIGYHRLLSHRSFRVPRWLERFFATCGALSCTGTTINSPIRMQIITTATRASGGATWAGCSSQSRRWRLFPGSPGTWPSIRTTAG